MISSRSTWPRSRERSPGAPHQHLGGHHPRFHDNLGTHGHGKDNQPCGRAVLVAESELAAFFAIARLHLVDRGAQWKTVKAGLLGKTRSMHGHHRHDHPPKPHGAGERLCFGIALERGGEQVHRVPLAGETSGTSIQTKTQAWTRPSSHPPPTPTPLDLDLLMIPTFPLKIVLRGLAVASVLDANVAISQHRGFGCILSGAESLCSLPLHRVIACAPASWLCCQSCRHG